MRWVVFCRVVDNFGDIGFAWRLCADLATRGEDVRLVVDDASALAWMAPGGCAGVTVADGSTAPVDSVDVAVETFGCGFADASLRAWSARAEPQPVLIDVEHLSAEGFVERSHGLASPPSADGLRSRPRWFYFPGFTARTGGLLREPGLEQRRLAYLATRGDAVATAASPVSPSTGRPVSRHVSAFCYDNDAFARLLDTLGDASTRVVCAPGAATEQACRWSRASAGAHSRVDIVAAPHRSQAAYDELLWSSDLNLVRGEESLVRAIWAERPFLWQLYPQDDGAHMAKLDAFLALFLAAAPPALAEAVGRAFRQWNGDGTGSFALPALPPWRAHCSAFAAALRAQADLSSQLIGFAGARR
ncbi:MAG: elongation factor P maturation arginine rhamnosyltransferase EarP [Pseudomonadota bacterium]|nr:elongation factor P maturation arginine rhamnosyltransferase EarP [Pseudomonadota bacterium]